MVDTHALGIHALHVPGGGIHVLQEHECEVENEATDGVEADSEEHGQMLDFGDVALLVESWEGAVAHHPDIFANELAKRSPAHLWVELKQLVLGHNLANPVVVGIKELRAWLVGNTKSPVVFGSPVP